MSRAFYLYDTSFFDTWDLAISGVARNAHAQAAPLSTVQRAPVSLAYTTAEIANSGTITIAASLPVGMDSFDTILMPGFQVLGEDLPALNRPRSINTKPTGTLALSGIAPGDPLKSGTVFFRQERISAPNIIVDTWRGFAGLTFPKSARNALTINLTLTVGQKFRVVIPRILVGVRYTPPHNFQNEPQLNEIDPIQLGRRGGAFVTDSRKNPYRSMALTYRNLSLSDIEDMENMFQSVAKTVPMGVCIRPPQMSTLWYARMPGLQVGYDFYNQDDVDYNTATIQLEEVSRDSA